MGPGQALSGFQLRLPVGFLVLQQLGKDIPHRRLRVSHGLNRLVAEVQALPSAGKVAVDGGDHLLEPPYKVGPVVDEHRSGLSHTEGKLIQGVQEGGFFRPVPENADLMFIKLFIFRQGHGIPGAELADALV